MSLPPASANQAYCDVSALEAGLIRVSLAHFTTSVTSDDLSTVPSLAFLLQHSATHDKFVFDLGIRKDWENLPPRTLEIIKTTANVDIPQDVVESLAKGGTSPSDISTVCLSHVHFDHAGDPSLFPESTFLVGEESRHIPSAISSQNPNAVILNHLLPAERTKYVSSTDWQPLGPFSRALDYYGDGSLYIVEAAGHLPGHINILARTSADGAWIYLAGDSAHHWDLITGKGDIAEVKVAGFSRCVHLDKEAAEQHILCIRKLLEIPRVRVLLAHDLPWYGANKGGQAFWPGKIASLE